MRRRMILSALAVLSVMVAVLATTGTAKAAGNGQPYDWGRFYYYPYVYYPHNFAAPVQFDHLYYRYPQERQIPVYNMNWYSPYIEPAPYHKGSAFILDAL